MNSYIQHIKDLHHKPCACHPWFSYRYKGRYGWIMIGASNDADALTQAALSTDNVVISNLERWDGKKYIHVI